MTLVPLVEMLSRFTGTDGVVLGGWMCSVSAMRKARGGVDGSGRGKPPVVGPPLS
jgi:hypothetical protein